MKIIKMTIACCLLSLSVLAVAGERLTGDQLLVFWNGSTIVGQHYKRGQIRTYHGEDGTVISRSADGSERRGVWWIDKAGEKKCIKWQQRNKPRCHYTEKGSDGGYLLVHGRNGRELVQIESVLKGKQL